MSLNFVEFASTVNAAIPVLEHEFEEKATQLIAKFNVQSSLPYVPASDPFYSGGQFSRVLSAASAGLGRTPIESIISRDTAFAELDDQIIYSGAIKAAKGFYDKWFGTPTTDQLLTTAYDNMMSGSVTGLVDEYIAINIQEANEIKTQALLKYNRDEDALLSSAGRFMAPRIPGPVYRELGLLKETMHETIREQLRKLGGEGLQRDYQLIMGVITERLKLNGEAKRAMGGWISGLDNPLFAAKNAKDNQQTSGLIAKAGQIMDLSSRVQSFDKQGLSLANERLGAVRSAAFAPAFGAHDRNRLELNHLTQDLSALGTELAGTYNRLRGSFGASWGYSTSQATVRTKT